MMENAAHAETQEFAARIGLDWADQKHFWTMLTADGKRTRGELKHTPEAIEIWAGELARCFDGRPIALALELKRGSLVAIAIWTVTSVPLTCTLFTRPKERMSRLKPGYFTAARLSRTCCSEMDIFED